MSRDDRDTFHCKQFTVLHRQDVFRITSDSLMLGAWAEMNYSSQVLEIGCGTGIISLMITQKQIPGQVLAIDVNPKAVALSKHNFLNSPWNNQLKCLQVDFKKPGQDILKQKFDHIICNPPFFEDGIVSQHEVDVLARHDKGIRLQELLQNASTILQFNGTIQMIIPHSRIRELKVYLQNFGLHMHRLTYVRALPDKTPYRVLTEFGKAEKENLINHLNMYDKPQQYSLDYQRLLEPYMTIF